MNPYRWTILAVGTAAQGALAAVQQGLPALGPALRDAYGLSLPEVGLVLASVSWGIMLTLLAWGALADRIGERTVICLGLAGATLALTAAAWAPSFAWLVFALAVAGALGGSASAASGRAVMGWFDRSERGMALGVRQMAVPMGGAIAAVALPLAVALGGLRAALLLLGGACAAGALAAGRWLREPPPTTAQRPPVAAPRPLRDRRVWRLSVASALLVWAQIALLAFCVLFLHDARGLSAAAAAGVLALMQLGGALARVLAGRRSDRRGPRIAPLRRLGLATAAALLATAALASAPLLLLVPVLVVAGVLSMSWNGLSFTAAAELSGRDQAGTALGLQGTVMRALSAGTAIAFGALVSATSWPLAFALLAFFPLSGALLTGPLVADEERRTGARHEWLRRQSLSPAPRV